METEAKLFICIICIIAAFFAVIIGTMSMSAYDDNLVSQMIRAGVNPYDARCSMLGQPQGNAICVLRASIKP